MSISQRIQIIIDRKTKGIKDFATKTGYQYGYARDLQAGIKSIGLDPIKRILTTFPEIDARWLVFGDGEMEMTNKDTQMVISLQSKISLLESLLKESRDENRELIEEKGRQKQRIEDLENKLAVFSPQKLATESPLKYPDLNK